MTLMIMVFFLYDFRFFMVGLWRFLSLSLFIYFTTRTGLGGGFCLRFLFTMVFLYFLGVERSDLYFLDFFFVIFLGSLGGRACTYSLVGLGRVLESCIFFSSAALLSVQVSI